ncbi:MAG: hypothetical protein RBR77_15135 [Thauera sp.]|jgi:hypothetical protein|nr:hypothetical protein [Thauera sp.]
MARPPCKACFFAAALNITLSLISLLAQNQQFDDQIATINCFFGKVSAISATIAQL